MGMIATNEKTACKFYTEYVLIYFYEHKHKQENPQLS
jgi:hypothetical protein